MLEQFWLYGVTAVAGGVGAVLRLLLDGGVTALTARRGRRPGLPWGTLAVNLSGSLLIGITAGLFSGGGLGESARWVIAVGLLGGYTTFSTASFETVRLLRQGRWALALVHGPGQLVLATLAAAAGLWIGVAVST